MYATCLNNRSGYEHSLVIGKVYDVLDIQEAIFAGEYYATVDIGNGKTASTHLYRFDITKQVAKQYIKLRALLLNE